MAINNHPPQAYTRETVAEAFEWMKSQSPSTRDLAKDANTLVSLYLNAKRHKRIKNMQPEDAAEFQTELKSLARGIKQFNQDSDLSQQPLSHNVDFEQPSLTINEVPQESVELPEPSLQIKTEPTHAQQKISTPAVPTNYRSKFINPQEILRANNITPRENSLPLRPETKKMVTQAPKGLSVLKPKTKNMIEQAKQALNLSSDEEALNALVAMGFQQIKSIFKV